jgi:tetratricopeptide (TPR) repeat protein
MFREVGNKYGLTEGLFSLGEAARLQGRYDKATTVLEESLVLARDSGDKFRTAYHLYTLGEVAVAQGDYESAARRYEEGLAIGQETGNPGLSAYGFCGLGGVALVQGGYEQATRKFEGALATSRKTGNKFGTALALLGLGRVARSQGHLVSAREFNVEAIEIFREEVGNSMDATQRVAHCLEAFAFLAVTQKQMRRATYLFGAAETLFTPVRYTMSSKERAEHDQAIATARATLGEEAFAAVWAKGKVMTMKQAIEYALETENESKEAQLPGE